jgi:hypothetical protein
MVYQVSNPTLIRGESLISRKLSIRRAGPRTDDETNTSWFASYTVGLGLNVWTGRHLYREF